MSNDITFWRHLPVLTGDMKVDRHVGAWILFEDEHLSFHESRVITEEGGMTGWLRRQWAFD